MATLNFDAGGYQPASGVLDPIPAGWYNVQLIETELKPTKAGDGNRLSLKFKILDGQYVGRIVFEGLNVNNPNAEAQNIARSQYSAICYAVGRITNDTDQLLGIPLKIRVKIEPGKDGYEPKNAVTAYKNINEVVTGGSNVVSPPQFQAPPQPQFAVPQQSPQPFTPPATAQPWQQPAQAAPQAAPVAQAATAAVAPQQQPAWAQAAPPQAAIEQQVAPAVAQQAAPAVAPAAVQQAQQAVPPWQRQAT